MPFIAECVFCATKVKVPDHAAGTSMVCPRCHSSFTIVPAARLPLAKPVGVRKAPRPNVTPAEPIFAVPAATLKASRETPAVPAPEERIQAGVVTPPAAAPPVDPMEGLGEQTEIQDFEPAVEEAPADLEVRPPRPRKPRRRVSAFGAIAFLLGSLALVSASLSALDFLAVPLSATGFGCGLIGLLVSGLSRKSGLLVPGVGSAVSLAVLVVAAFFPSWLGILPQPGEGGLHLTGKQTVVARSNIGLEPNADAPEWFDISHGSLQQDDLRLRVASVAVEFFDMTVPGKQKPQRERGLVVRLRLTNIGTARRIDYESWGEKHLPILTDHTGKTYPLKAFAPGAEVAGRQRGAALFPGKTVDDLLVFEVPPPNVEYLRLELPASACASPGKFQLHIPKSQIRR